MSNVSGLSPYMDSGTGLYEGPPAEVTYGAENDPEPTGAVEGPPVSVTVESPPDHLAGPTGASPNPPAVVEMVQHPGRRGSKAVKAADVEDKAVKPAEEASSVDDQSAPPGVVGSGDDNTGPAGVSAAAPAVQP